MLNLELIRNRERKYKYGAGRKLAMGIATLLVMLVHAKSFDWTGIPVLLYKIMEFGSIGVDVFLFLSGLGLYFSMSKCDSVKKFYCHRFLRVFCPYFFISGVMYGIIYFLGDIGFSDYILLISTLYLWVRGTLNVTWYVSFILILYLIYPIIYKILSKRRNEFFLLSLLILSLTCIFIVYPEIYDKYEVLLSRIPIFIIGSVAGKYEFEGQTGMKPIILDIGIFILIQSLLILYGNPLVRYYQLCRRVSYIFGAMAICQFSAILSDRVANNIVVRIIKKIGDASLEIYIVHALGIEIFQILTYELIKQTLGIYLLFIVIPSIFVVLIGKEIYKRCFIKNIIYENSHD